MSDTEIQDFYRDQVLLITGGTGFLGKIIIEKLLSTTKIRKIILIVREKKGVCPVDRIDSLLKEPVFETLRRTKGNCLDRLEVHAGDTGVPNFSLSADVLRSFEEEVNIIIHSAATVKFNENLRRATAVNVYSTIELLNLAKRAKNLKAFVHVSTAFAFGSRFQVGEEFYPPPITFKSLKNLCDLQTDEEVSRITPKLLGQTYPNTYVYSKSVAEDVIRTQGTCLPVCIVRPVSVTNTHHEPIPGWIDNYYGAAGVMAAAAMGMVRTFICDKNIVVLMVPVDLLGNCIIASAWDVYSRNKNRDPSINKKTEDIPIYNFAPYKNTITWREMGKMCTANVLREPPLKLFWIPDMNMTMSKVKFTLMHLFFELFPALLCDLGSTLMGRSADAVKQVKRTRMFFELSGGFFCAEFCFDTRNVITLFESLSMEDKKLFKFDMTAIVWHDYLLLNYRGIRQYLFKDPPTTIPQASKRLRRFQIIKACTPIIGLLIIVGIIALCVLYH